MQIDELADLETAATQKLYPSFVSGVTMILQGERRICCHFLFV
jgi:hypothetical protein